MQGQCWCMMLTIISEPGMTIQYSPELIQDNCPTRALCRIKLLPVTHVLVDTWMLTVRPVYKLLNVSDDLKWFLHFFTRPPPIHPYFYLSIFVFTRPNDGWTGLYIKLCVQWSLCPTVPVSNGPCVHVRTMNSVSLTREQSQRTVLTV